MKILIVDDHEIVRKGLKMLLEGEEDIEGIDEAEGIEEGLKKLALYAPELTIVDINLNGTNGLKLIEEAKKKKTTSKFVVFTSSSRKGDFERARELEVEGYILKDSGIEDILYAFNAINRGRCFYDDKITQVTPPNNREKILGSLTDREKEIFIQIGKGLSNLEIAEKLYISENTVKKHITSLMGKLGVKRRTEVALYATKMWRRSNELQEK